MKDENSDNIYSKWLNNELSEDVIKSLEESGELDALRDIITEVDTWGTPEIKSDYKSLKLKIDAKKRKGKIISLYQKLSIAASIILIIGLGIGVLTSESETTYVSNFGEIKTITFPDGTQAVLNGNSTLSFVEDDWKQNRIVKLNGQAYFDINLKGDFEVQINGGSIKVLGTKFDVLTYENYNIVKCFEGVVGVNTIKINDTISIGEGIDSKNHPFQVLENQPNWMSDYTKFSDAKLIEVIGALSLKFDVKIDYRNVKIENKKFTGQFSNSDQGLALKMVFKPLGIMYTLKDNIVLLK